MRCDRVDKSKLIELGFRDEVIQKFKFLENDYRYYRIKTGVDSVIYQSNNVSLTIYHGRVTYSMGIEVELICDSPIKGAIFTLREILELIGRQDEYEESFYFTKKESRVKELVIYLSGLLKIYGRNILIGDVESFRKMYEIRTRLFETHSKKMEIKNRKEYAEYIWRDKNYHKYISLLEPIEDSLTRLEKKKLEYARKLFHVDVKYCIK